MNQNETKVASIISQQKQQQLITNIFQTLSGVNKKLLQRKISVFWIIILILITLICPIVIQNKPSAIIIPTIFNIIINLILYFLLKSDQINISTIIFRTILLGIFSFLWSGHIFYIRRSCSANQQIYQLIFTSISVITSICTVAVISVKQFSGNNVEYQQFRIDSTAFIRFFIALPTLLSQFIIVYSQSGYDNDKMYPLRLANSLIFLTWTLGWLSSFKTTLNFVLNKVSMIIFGQQSQQSFLYCLCSIILNMGPIAVFYGIFDKNKTYSISCLIVGATLSSLLMFVLRYVNINQFGKITPIRSIANIIIQISICVGLCLLVELVNLKSVNISIFLGIDIGIYIFFLIVKQLIKGWSIFSCSFQIKYLKYSIIRSLQHILLRIFSGLSILLLVNNYTAVFLKQFNYQSNIINYIIFPFLSYRSFKRTVSYTTSFSLHVSLLLGLILINSGYQAKGALLILMMPPFPNNPIQSIISVFNIPQKARHQKQCQYQILYFIITLFSIIVYFLTLGIFQFTSIFGLPLYCLTIPSETQGYQAKSVQNSLYQKIIQSIDLSMFRMYGIGYYLLRIQKYIILLQVQSNCYGMLQTVRFRGLQVQEVTSCHSKQGQTIDKLVQQTWGDNKTFTNFKPYYISITPFVKQLIFVPTQNQIKLTGIIQDKQFFTLFKQTSLKAIIRQVSKLKFTENQKKQALLMLSQLSPICKKDHAQKIIPFSFGKQLNLNMIYPIQSNKTKLPPLKNQKKNVIDDFGDLMFESSKQHFQTTVGGLNQKQKQHPQQPKIQQLNLSIVYTLYHYSLGKQDYLNNDRLFKLIKRQPKTLPQIQFDDFQRILSLALSSSLKICLDKFILGQRQVNLQDFTEYQNNYFLGTSDNQQFRQAILSDKQIWTISYLKKTINIKRLAKSQTNMYIFKIDQTILKSTWNNLRFQLLYATNNNDQRYSIQTHPTLLRNLWVEACEQPFGYPSYYSPYYIIS